MCDWDGVLCDSFPSHQKVKKIMESEFGDIAKNTGGKNAREFFLSRGIDRETISRYFRRFRELEEFYGAPAHEDANNLLIKASKKGMICGALSNRGPNEYNFQNFAASGIKLELLDFFVLYNSEKIEELNGQEVHDEISGRKYIVSPYAKPNQLAAEPIRHRLLDYPNYPHSIIYVGDNIIDFEFAKSNGFRFFGVLSGEVQSEEQWKDSGLKEKDGDAIIQDISEILEMI